MGNENFTAAPSGTFRTGSGPLNIAANEQKQYETLCDLVGRPDLKSDPRFAERQARKVNRAALTAELETALQARSAQEWEALFNSKGVPAGCVLSVPEVLQEEQIVGRKFVETLPLDNHVGQPLRVTRPGLPARRGVPGPGSAAHPRPGHRALAHRTWLQLRRDRGIARERGCRVGRTPDRAGVPKLPELKVRAESSST